MANLSVAYVITLCYDDISRHIRLPTIRREYEKINAKYQMHYRLRELANPSRPPLYPIVHIDGDTLSQALTRFSKYLMSQFI